MSKQDWYSTDSWYEPMEAPAGEQKTRKRRRTLSFRWRLAIGLGLVIGLIILSSVLFSTGEQETIGGFQYGEEMPDDWQDYFEAYYAASEQPEVVLNLERAELVPDFRLELAPPVGDELSLQQLYSGCADSIVALRGYVEDYGGFYWGSGIIMSEDGLILTNSHVVEGCDTMSVELYDGSEYDAKLVGADPRSDIAVLRIEAEGLPAAVFGDSAALSVGDKVAAIGNPLSETFLTTLTDGIVSGIERGMDYNGSSMTLIQTNTAINEGNSGGALLNMYGQVIGVTNMKMTSYYSSIEGIGFAIPTATVKTVVDSLVKYGEVRGRTAIGITVGPVMDNAAEHYDIPSGLYVSAVSEGSDAEKKGIEVGDIVTHANGVALSENQDLLDIKDELSVGDSISFTVWREGEVFTVDVELIDMNDVY